MENLNILCFDGGGIRGYSSLLVLAAIMRSIHYDDPTHGSLDDIHPYKYFDVISGAGTGGVLAFLLGQLKLTIPECLLEYRKLSAHVLRDGPGLPLCSIDKLRAVSRKIGVEKFKTLALGEEGSPEIFGFGVSQNKPYCFRGPDLRFDCGGSELDPHAIGLDDVFAAMMTAKGLFDAYELSHGKRRRLFQDRAFPYSFSNPVVEVLDELHKVDNPSVDMIVSIGGGEVADEDIPDLLLLEDLADRVGTKLCQILPKAVSDIYLHTISFSHGHPDTIIHRFRSEQEHRQVMLRNKLSERIPNIEEVYKRFSIGPVKNVGPNDYLSVEEVGEASKEYVEFKKERIQAVGSQLRESGIRPRYQLSHHHP